MSSLNQVIDYLTNKISRVNLKNPKANTGGALIKTHKGWEDEIERIVALSFQMIQSQFTKHGDYEAGEAALTATSMIIGKITAKIISREPISVTHQLRLGDLIICLLYTSPSPRD